MTVVCYVRTLSHSGNFKLVITKHPLLQFLKTEAILLLAKEGKRTDPSNRGMEKTHS